MKPTHSNQFLPEGILHNVKPNPYMTKDGQAVFAFSYHRKGYYYEIAIHQLPNYKGRNDCSSVAHWLPCDISPIKKKICFHSGKEPTTLEKAHKISVQFAELTWTYIKTGVSIDDQIIRNN